ncbi:MAG: hypothetical protein ACRBM6_09995 [Geminicoccales bacterium]
MSVVNSAVPDLVHAILDARTPEIELGRGFDTQDRMDQIGEQIRQELGFVNVGKSGFQQIEAAS